MNFPSFHWWRTVFFLIPTIAVYTLVLGTLSLCSSLFESAGRLAHRCARAWAWLILATTGVRVRVTGAERLTPDTTYVFVANHQSIYDIPILFASLPVQLRMVAKASLGRVPVLGWHLRRTAHILVDRGHPGASVFKRVSTLMEQGLSLMVFPEGTRSVDGQVGRFKAGIFFLAIGAGLPVVPLSVVGSRHVMRKGRLRVCPGEVVLVVHEPIETGSLAPNAARALADRVRQTIRATVEETQAPRGD